MILRVFGVIWGALVLTLLLFGLVVATLNLPPPDDARIETERKVLLRQLELVAARDGTDAALALWSQVAEAFPETKVVTDPSCTDQAAIKGTEGTCLTLTFTSQGGGLLLGFRLLLMPLLVGVAVCAAAAFFLSRHLTRPIRIVDAALRRLAGGALETRIGGALHRSSGEIVRLGAAFDHAAERLQNLSEGQRRLFHDLSHEVRSPLARMRAATGLLEASPDRLPEMLHQIETDITRMDQLVRDILTLARFDSAEARPAFKPLDLVEIIEPILSDANFEGSARKVTVTYTGPARLEVNGSAELLHRALENVIRNALAHSPNKGLVTIETAQHGAACLIEIADQGAGVPDAEKPKLFGPFIRLQNPQGHFGSGLGLAIAASAIAAHSGRIDVLDNAPTGLRIRMTLTTAGPQVAKTVT